MLLAGLLLACAAAYAAAAAAHACIVFNYVLSSNLLYCLCLMCFARRMQLAMTTWHGGMRINQSLDKRDTKWGTILYSGLFLINFLSYLYITCHIFILFYIYSP